MPSINNERWELPTSVLTDDHTEIDTLTGALLAALEEGDKLKVFARLDLLWARLAVHIRAEHLWLFPSILEANFSYTGSGPTYQEAQDVISSDWTMSFSCVNWERALTACGNDNMLLTMK